MLVFPPYNISRFVIPLFLPSDHNTELLSHIQLEFLHCALLLEFEIAFLYMQSTMQWVAILYKQLSIYCTLKKTPMLLVLFFFFNSFLLALNPTKNYVRCLRSGYDFRVEILHNFVTCCTLRSHLPICLKALDMFPSILLVFTSQPCCLSLAFLLHLSQRFLP